MGVSARARGVHAYACATMAEYGRLDFVSCTVRCAGFWQPIRALSPFFRGFFWGLGGWEELNRRTQATLSSDRGRQGARVLPNAQQVGERSRLVCQLLLYSATDCDTKCVDADAVRARVQRPPREEREGFLLCTGRPGALLLRVHRFHHGRMAACQALELTEQVRGPRETARALEPSS